MKFWVARNGQPVELEFSEMKCWESGFPTREDCERDIARAAEYAGKPPVEMCWQPENPGRLVCSRRAPEVESDQEQVDRFLRTC